MPSAAGPAQRYFAPLAQWGMAMVSLETQVISLRENPNLARGRAGIDLDQLQIMSLRIDC